MNIPADIAADALKAIDVAFAERIATVFGHYCDNLYAERHPVSGQEAASPSAIARFEMAVESACIAHAEARKRFEDSTQ